MAIFNSYVSFPEGIIAHAWTNSYTSPGLTHLTFAMEILQETLRKYFFSHVKNYRAIENLCFAVKSVANQPMFMQKNIGNQGLSQMFHGFPMVFPRLSHGFFIHRSSISLKCRACCSTSSARWTCQPSHIKSSREYEKHICFINGQWPFQEPKLEVPTIYKAYCLGLNFREYPHKIWPTSRY